MANLYFKTDNDYEAVVKLRAEIAGLESQLKKLDVNKSPTLVKNLESQLNFARQQMNAFVVEAAKAGKAIGSGMGNSFNAEKQAMNQYLSEYGTYMEKRQAIMEMYNASMAQATTKGEKLSLGEEMSKSLSGLDEEAQRKTSAFGKLFSDMSKRAVADMRTIADNAENALAFIDKGEWNEEKGISLGITAETFNVLKKSPEKLDEIRNKVEEVRDAASQSDNAFVQLGAGLKTVFTSGSDMKSLQAGLSKIEGSIGAVMQAGELLSKAFSTMGTAFRSDALKEAAGGIDMAMDAVSSTMSGAQAGATFGPWGAAIGATIGLVTSLTDSFIKLNDQAHEEKIQEIEVEVEALNKAYDELDSSIRKAFSSDAAKLYEDQIRMLENQNSLVRQQIEEEKGKKEADDNRIKELGKKIEENNKKIADSKEKAIDVIFGSDIQTAINNFAQAYANAWASGNDRAKTSKDLVKNMIKEMVMEAMKMDIGTPMKDIRTKLSEFWNNDKKIDGNEKAEIYKLAGNLTKDLGGKYAWADEFMKGDSAGSGGNGKVQAEELHKQQAEYEKLVKQQGADKKRALEDMHIQFRQLNLDLEKESTAKKIEQIKLDYDKEYQAIRREEEELLRKNTENARALHEANPDKKKGAFDASAVTLSEDEGNYFAAKYSNASVKKNTGIDVVNDADKQAMNQYLSEYGTYMEKRQTMIETYNAKIAKAATEGEKLSLAAAMNNSLSALDEEAQKKTSAFGKLFSDMSKRAVKDMQAIADSAEAALKFVEGGEWDAEKGAGFGISKETFDRLKKSPEELEKIKNAIKGVREGANQADTAFAKLGAGLKTVFSSQSDIKSFKKGLGEVSGSMGEIMQAGKLLSSAFSTMGDAFDSQALSSVGEGMNTAMDAMSGAMSGAQAGAAFGPWGAAAGAAIGLATSLTSSFAKMHDKKHEKKIQQIQEKVEELNESYKDLDRAIQKAFSNDAAKLYGDQNVLLENQKELIGKQIEEEKKKKKPDKNRVKEWEGQLKEIDKKIADNKEKAVDAIFGEDLKSAINNFAQAYANAWASGDDRAKAAKDMVKNMIKNMIIEAMKADISGPMEEIRQKLVEFWKDGVIDANEQAELDRLTGNLTNRLDSQYGWADNYMKGDSADKSAEQSSTSRGFETMTQDTASELNGRFTALQMAGEEIKNQNLIQSQSLVDMKGSIDMSGLILQSMYGIADDTRAIIANSYLELQNIRENTGAIIKPIKEMNERLDQIEKNTRAL